MRGTSTSSLVGAALAALLWCGAAFGAVPVEESVDELSGEVVAGDAAAEEPLVQREPPRSRRLPRLEIPPTIEPPPDNSERPLPGSAGAGRAGTDPSRAAGPGYTGAGVSRSGATAPGEGNLRDLFYQLQVLQQEVQTLRGQVEEQQFLITRLQRDQKEQYLDLDGRVLALTENRPPPGPVNSEPSAPAVPLSGDLSERDAYRLAFEAMRAQDFEASAAGFRQLIESWPNGQYTPNAFYWLGEIFLVADSDVEQARQSFMQVINLYPDHQKTPDAMYKLGVVYHTLGDAETARRFLTRVQNEHPDTSAADLARKFAQDML